MIKILNDKNLELDYKFFLFSGGEVSVKLNGFDYNFFKTDSYKILAHIHNSNDAFVLAMIKDALFNIKKLPIELVIPYFPYARQDRVCDNGESFSLKVFANFINSLNFDSVVIIDPHSDVTPALINNCKVISRLNIFQKWEKLKTRCLGNCVFISPDAGANKKISELAAYFEHKEFIRADKLRDLSNGNIKETIIYADNLNGADVIIADDICDGGMTFIKLTEALKTINCGKVVLYVTHGIFSKGFDVLLKSGINEIWTTNSFNANFIGDLPKEPKLNILNLNNLVF